MKLFFLIDYFGYGGKEHRCLQLIKELNGRGYNDIYLILFNNIVVYTDLYKMKLCAIKWEILQKKRQKKSLH
jgi:hypothetical protein